MSKSQIWIYFGLLAYVAMMSSIACVCVSVLAMEIKVGSLIELGRDLECRGLQSFQHPWNGGRSEVSITPGMEGGPKVSITLPWGKLGDQFQNFADPWDGRGLKVSIIPPWRVVGQAPEFNDVTAYIP